MTRRALASADERRGRSRPDLEREADRIGESFARTAQPLRARQATTGAQGLPTSVAEWFEPRFGHDLRDVRLETGGQAEGEAERHAARALTGDRRIRFGRGEYEPRTQRGRALLGHELAHVIQQTSSGAPALQAKSKSNSADEDAICGGLWTCAHGKACDEPDNPEAGPFQSTDESPMSGAFTLTVHVDVEADSLQDVTTDTGHTYVEFNEPSGARWTYGFYPDPAHRRPDILMGTKVRGCVVHPDTSHASCVDYRETFTLDAENYYRALFHAQDQCRRTPSYDLLIGNCATFAGAVVQAAGQSLPNMRGQRSAPFVGSIAVDNPNTLYDSLKERDDKASGTR